MGTILTEKILKECPHCKEQNLFKAQKTTVTFSPEETARANFKNRFLNQKLNELFSAFNRGADGEMDKIFTEIYNFNQEYK